jgi:UDP-N-acetylmuramyl pentapeptide phosphotransferase/UDP-N-acetylglucosamine-1-phosphate transferase
MVTAIGMGDTGTTAAGAVIMAAGIAGATTGQQSRLEFSVWYLARRLRVRRTNAPMRARI